MTQTIQHIEPTAQVISDGFAKQSQEHAAKIQKVREQNRQLQEVVSQLNETMGVNNTKLTFAVDRNSDTTIITVVDTETQEVIRQIPSEEALKVAQHVKSMMGILYDASA